MGKIILFSLSFIYLIAEYIFNVNLVSMLGNDSSQNYLYVDVVGRSVSSIGGTLLFIRLIILSKVKPLSKFFLTLFFTPILFLSFYFAQEKVVDIVADYTSNDVKISQFYTYAYKKGILNSSIDFNKIPKKSKDNSFEDLVFFTSVSFWGFGYNEFINLPDKKNINSNFNDLESIFSDDFKRNNTYYYRGYKRASSAADTAFNKYSLMNGQYNDNIDKINREADKHWDIKEDSERKLISGYEHIKKKYLITVKKDVFDKSSAIYSDFYLLAGCGTISCWESVNKTLLRKGVSFYESCKFKSSGSKNVINFNSSHLSNNYMTRTSHINNFSDKYSFYCNVDLDTTEKINLSKVSSFFKDEYGISDFSYVRGKTFAKSKELSNAIRHMAKVKYNLDIPYGWHKDDKVVFYKAFKDEFLIKLNNSFYIRMEKEVGFSIPLNLSKGDFFTERNVVNYMNDNMGVYGGKGFSPNFSREQFYNHYVDIIGSKMSRSYSENINNPDFVDEIFKLTIVPIVAVSFSLIFGLFNLAVILKEVFCFIFNIKDRVKNSIILSFFVLVLFITPYFINNHYTDHVYFEHIYNSFESVNPLMAHIYKWFLNTETLVFSLSDYLYYEIPFKDGNYLKR